MSQPPVPPGRKSAAPEPVTTAQHEAFMQKALIQARMAMKVDEVPVGAVVVVDGQIVADGYNQPVRTHDPSAHAEMVALRRAARELQNYRLTGATVYVTLEPCLMCVGALLNARVATVVYAVPEPKWGAVTSLMDLSQLRTTHRFEVVAGILAEDCRKLIVDFFRFRREER